MCSLAVFVQYDRPNPIVNSQNIIVISTADWDNPLWTNKQHLSARWGRAGHRVLYVESLGLRRPGFSGQDARRVWRRLRRANRLRKMQVGVWVLSPLLAPLHGHAWVRRANSSWLAWVVRRALRRLDFRQAVLWTYNPLVLEYLGDLPWHRIVYHCVDELTGSPGLPKEIVEQCERALIRHADLVVVSAPTLAESKRPLARRLEYLPNPADFRHFSCAADPDVAPAAELTPIPRPRIGFVGAISEYKVDTQTLRTVFGGRRDWHLVMVGPLGEGDPGTSVDELRALPNVHFLGTQAFERLPLLIRGFDVCLLPSRLNKYTEHMFPLKFFEYLASGKPVVMPPLPALHEYWHLAYIASAGDASAFTSSIAEALVEPENAPIRSERILEASRHDWDLQAKRLMDLVMSLD